MVQAGVGELTRAVVAGWGKAEHADVPMEIAGVPSEHERRERGVAGREIGVAGLEVEGSEGPEAERAGDLGNADANIDIHGNHARNHRDGVSSTENLPGRHVSERGDRGGVVLLDAELGETVEDGPVGVALIVIGVGAEIEARHGGNDAAKNVGVALDPGTGTELGGVCAICGKNDGAAERERRHENVRCCSAAQPTPKRANPRTHFELPAAII